MYDKYWDSLTESLWSPESWVKVLILLVTAPVWFPIVRTMFREVQEVLAPEGGLYANRAPRPIRRRPPGEDPFLKIPLARERGRRPARAAATDVRQHELVPRGTSDRRAVHDVNRGARRARAPQRRGF